MVGLKDAGGANSLGSMRSLGEGGDGADGSAGGKHHLQKVLLKPADQVALNDAELAEEYTRILNANNPKAAQNYARYNFRERSFKAAQNTEHHVFHYEYDGYLFSLGDATGAVAWVGGGMSWWVEMDVEYKC